MNLKGKWFETAGSCISKPTFRPLSRPSS